MYELGTVVVNLAKKEWGSGKILAIEGTKLTIYFRDSKEKPIKKMSACFPQLEVAKNQKDPLLDNLPEYQPKNKKLFENRLTFEEGMELFKTKYPLGFDDPEYIREERTYKIRAHELFESSLDNGKAEQFVGSENFEELKERLLAVESRVNLLSRFEKMALREGLKNETASRQFLKSLVSVVSKPEVEEKSFNNLIDAVENLPVEPGKSKVASWPVLTLFPFLAKPQTHMFMKPQYTVKCAKRLAFDLGYSSQFKFSTYRKLLDLSNILLERLKPLGVRDHIDVQSFIGLIGDKKNLAKS